MPRYAGREKEYMREWRAAHPGYATEATRRFRKARPERQGELREIWNVKNPAKRRIGRNSWKRGGLSPDQLLEIFESQGRACAICQASLTFPDRQTHVDHCHATGVFRGILCRRCNQQLGHYEAWPDFHKAAAAYLQASHVDR